MATLEQIHAIFLEIGPLMPEIQKVFQTDEKAWSICFDEETAVDFRFDEQQQKLVLSTGLGCPPEHARPKMYEVLLTYNAMHNETGGVVLSVSGPKPDDEAMQTFELNSSELHLGAVQNTLRNFHQKAEFWRDLIRRGFEETTPGDGLPTDGAIKV